MSLEYALKLLEEIEQIEPGEKALEKLATVGKRRSFNLSEFKPVHGACCWCNKNPIPKGKRKYCSQHCQDSAYRYCNPQSPFTKAYVLIHIQSCACPICGLLYEEQIIKEILEGHASLVRAKKAGYKVGDKVSYWKVGYNTGHIWEVDHIVPIYKGGASVGLTNIQVICVECHRKKTIAERKYDR